MYNFSLKNISLLEKSSPFFLFYGLDHTLNAVDNINRQKEDYLAQFSRGVQLIDDDLEIEDSTVSGFIESGNDAVLTMINLMIGEFMEIYADVESEIQIVQRGPKTKISPKDSLFITLAMLKGYFKGMRRQIYLD